jgi:hypothetical protein
MEWRSGIVAPRDSIVAKRADGVDPRRTTSREVTRNPFHGYQEQANGGQRRRIERIHACHLTRKRVTAAVRASPARIPTPASFIP